MGDSASEIKAPSMLVMGVGSSGSRAVLKMKSEKPELNAVVVDTDSKVLEGMPSDLTAQIGRAVTHGLSAGGDVELGRQSIEKDSSEVRQLLRSAEFVVIVAGLGGGTASGAVPVITRLARETGTLVLCMVSTPFAFEGKGIAKVADEAVKRIRTHADAVVRLNNETLVTRADADLPMEEAFSRGHEIMNNGLLSLWRMLQENGICGLDFACIHTMLRNCDGFCHFASAEADGDERGTTVAEGLLKHRMLKGGKLLASATGIIVAITGGQDLKMSEVETVMTALQNELPEEIWLNFGVMTDPAFESRLSVAVLLAEQWKEPLVDGARRQMGFSDIRRGGLEQGELALETIGKGRFASLDPTIHDNQDLDVPAYIRRDIKLPR